MAAPQDERKARDSAAREPSVVVVVPPDVPTLCEQVRIVVERGDREIVCDVGALRQPDAATIDALCRLQLAARRHGGRIRLRDASDELLDLLAFVGLADVLELASVRRRGGRAGRRAGRTSGCRGRT